MDPLSAIASILTILHALATTSDAIRHLRGLPKAFKSVQQQLPLVEETLKIVRQHLEDPSTAGSNRKTAEPVLQSCHDKILALNKIFQEIDQRNDPKSGEWSVLVASYRTMLLRLGKAHRVETLMQDILDGLRSLATHQTFMVATKDQVKRLETAIQELSEVEPSLPDSEFEPNPTSFHQTVGSEGKGNMFNAVGGSMTNKFGNEFNTTGNMSFGTDFVNALMKNSAW